MAQEDRSPFTPPPTSLGPTLLIALALGVAVFAGWRLEGWWSARNTEALESVRAATSPPRLDATPAPRALTHSPEQPAPKSEPDAPLAWVRCEADGRVAYSDQGCGGIGAQKSSSADTRAALSTLPTGAAERSTTTIYRCKRFSGAVYWSSARCNQKKALIDRMVSVPKGLSLSQQVRLAERSLQRVPPATTVPAAPSSAPSASKRQAECRQLDERIRQLDAEARQALSAQRQDRLRAARRAARDRQFALHC